MLFPEPLVLLQETITFKKISIKFDKLEELYQITFIYNDNIIQLSK